MEHRLIKMLVFGAVLLAALMGSGPGRAAEPKAGSVPALKVALLPILDAFPFYVAEASGDFAAEGLKVEAVPVSSALERDQLMQARQIDGMLSELSTAAVFNRDGVKVKVVGVLREAKAGSPMFRVLAAPGSGLASPADLAGVPIGVAENTIIEYVTRRLLRESGVPADKIALRSVPAIPERYQLLMNGSLKAAVLPDPMGLSAIKAGAPEIINDAAFPRYAISVFAFSLKATTDKAEAVRRFLKAWEKAVARIEANPPAQVPLLLKSIRVPPNVQQGYVLPYYPHAKVPDEAQWNDVIAWLMEKKLLTTPLPYGQTVTPAFLPKP